MSNTIIHIEKLGKRYKIGARQRYVALRDVLTDAFATPFRRLRGSDGVRDAARAAENNFIWALREVSFDVVPGERIGIIGRNGAGKSTLLKILARVTRPTEGRADLRGRVGSLLEVGTGFHTELTGRENVFLSGAILGLRRREIEARFDEIVAFSGVEKFLDTPLKHYSTGMNLRLAFAVAAHLEPEILLVDEVLAVGDLEFQKKCLGKMEDVSRGGRTVIFVSHQMNQMRRLCGRIVWLDGGRVRQIGPTAEVIAAYEQAMTSGETAVARSASANGKAQFLRWEIVEPRGENPHILGSLGPVRVQFAADVRVRPKMAHLSIYLRDAEGHLVWGWLTPNLGVELGCNEFAFAFPMLPLRPGSYFWSIGLWDDESCMDQWEVLPAMIVATPSYQHWSDQWTGLLNLPCELEHNLANTTRIADVRHEE
jgi:lipopolysaccharide transport system ATP-binding protein